MSRRDNFYKTIAHQKTDSPPYFLTMCADLVRQFKQKHGDVDYRDVYDIPIREVFLGPTRLDVRERFKDWTDNMPPGCEINEWGVGMQHGGTAHFYKMLGPLAGRLTKKNITALPFPDFNADYRWEDVKKQVDDFKDRDYIVMSGIYGGADSGLGGNTIPAFIDVFESSWYLSGLDEMLMAMYSEPETAELMLGRMAGFKEEIAVKWAEAGVDILVFGDDVGTQRSLMMSGGMWRQFLKPKLTRIIKAAKKVNPDIVIFYHSDGNIEEIIPDLIEAGVEILNPVQPECMDPIEIAKKYGAQASFWGTIGTQTTFPYGSPEDVRNKCSEMISTVGKNGGLIIAPTHILEPDVPFENVEAFIDFIRVL